MENHKMITLKIDNSYSQVLGLNVKQFTELREILSYQVDAQSTFFSGDFRGGKRYLLDNRGTFPTGLLYLVLKYLKSVLGGFETHDKRRRPAHSIFPSLTLPYAAHKEQEEATTAALTHGRGIIVAPTGFGKSAIVALLCASNLVPTLVVVPKVELRDQLINFLSKALKAVSVGRLGSTIAVENIDALGIKDDYSIYHCVIIDEFHHTAAKTYRDLNKKAWNHIYYRFGLTATPFRSQDCERLLLESFLSQVIYEVKYDRAVAHNYIVPLEAYYIDLPPRNVEGNTWAQVYKELITENDNRNIIISNLIKSLHIAQKPTLCLVKEIAHGRRLAELTRAGFACGEDKDSKQLIEWFNTGKLKTLIATTGVCGEGVDTKPAEYVIIAGLGKSKNAFMQQCGRGFRKHEAKESCKVILFRDTSHKYTKAHYVAQVKYLKDEYGVKPSQISPVSSY